MSAAFQRHQVFTFPTPSRTDLLFYEIRDRVIPKNDPNNSTGTYGEAHWDSVKYPDHVLVHRSPHDPNKGTEKWWYAADRANQDEYNWNFTQANLGSVRFDAVERYYFYKRADFTKPNDTFASGTSSIEQGDPMPNTPTGKFDHAEFILSDRETIEAPEELRSLYIIEKRVYFRRKSIATVRHEEMLGIGQGSVITLHYRGESVGGTAIEDLINAPSNAYWGVQSDGTVRTGEQLTYRWFAVATLSSLDSALGAYKLLFPSTHTLRLPDVLVDATVVWNTASGIGNFDGDWHGVAKWNGPIQASLGGSEQASSSGSASVQPELLLNIKQGDAQDVPSTACFFYMKLDDSSVSESDFLEKVSSIVGSPVARWPVFHPVSHTVVLAGQKVGVSAQASASASISASAGQNGAHISKDKNEGHGESYDASTSMSVIRIPPTIHATKTIGGDLTKEIAAQASCNVGWNANSSGATIEGEPVSIYETNASSSAIQTATGFVSPNTLSETSPFEVPSSGKFIVESRVEPFRYGWVRCYAHVIDASKIEP